MRTSGLHMISDTHSSVHHLGRVSFLQPVQQAISRLLVQQGHRLGREAIG